MTTPRAARLPGVARGRRRACPRARGAPPKNFWAQIQPPTGTVQRWSLGGSYPANSVKVAGKDWVVEDDNQSACCRPGGPLCCPRGPSGARVGQVTGITARCPGPPSRDRPWSRWRRRGPGAGQSTWHLDARDEQHAQSRA